MSIVVRYSYACIKFGRELPIKFEGDKRFKIFLLEHLQDVSS